MEATQLELFPQEENNQQVEDTTPRFSEAEWCFQFFDTEPVVFAWSEEGAEAGDLILTINPTENSAISFGDKGMVFKLFSREISEETKKLREEKKALGK